MSQWRGWFDPHVHLDTRPDIDLMEMAVAGITDVVTLAHDPLRMSTMDVSMDHFYHLVEGEVLRGSHAGLRVHVALGMHPRAIPPDWERVIEAMQTLIKHPSVVAIGEIGMETASDLEVEVFTRQLELVSEIPAIIHTPRSNKDSITQRTIEIIEESDLEPRMLLIDHVSPHTIWDVLELGAYAGLTVQEGKLSTSDLLSIVSELEEDQLKTVVVNSDLSQAPSDPLTVARAAYELRRAEVEQSIILGLCSTNSKEFFMED